MTPDEVNAITGRLTATLAELAAGLRDADHERWASWVARDCDQVLRGDAHGLHHFLGAFGGMGSIDDLLLPPPLRERLSSAYADASVLLRELEAG